jgi:hypothetical protein
MALRLENFHSFIPPSENHLDLGRKSQQPGLGRARKGCARNENAIEIHAAWGKPLGKTNKQQDFGSHMQPKLVEAWGVWKPL